MVYDVMCFYDDRYGSEFNVSHHARWQVFGELRFIISDDERWIRYEQTLDGAAWPFTRQKIDSLARKFNPRARVVSTSIYGLPHEVPRWTRTYKVL